MSSVFARPGTPRSRQWPPAKRQVRISRRTCSLADDDAADLVVEAGDEVGCLLKGQARRGQSGYREGHTQYYESGRIVAGCSGRERTLTVVARTARRRYPVRIAGAS